MKRKRDESIATVFGREFVSTFVRRAHRYVGNPLDDALNTMAALDDANELTTLIARAKTREKRLRISHNKTLQSKYPVGEYVWYRSSWQGHHRVARIDKHCKINVRFGPVCWYYDSQQYCKYADIIRPVSKAESIAEREALLPYVGRPVQINAHRTKTLQSLNGLDHKRPYEATLCINTNGRDVIRYVHVLQVLIDDSCRLPDT